MVRNPDIIIFTWRAKCQKDSKSAFLKYITIREKCHTSFRQDS